MRWLSDRSGADGGFEVMVENIGPVAVGIGGESTDPSVPFKANAMNSHEAQVELQVCRAWWMVVWPVCRDF